MARTLPISRLRRMVMELYPGKLWASSHELFKGNHIKGLDCAIAWLLDRSDRTYEGRSSISLSTAMRRIWEMRGRGRDACISRDA